ncbi:MAG: helix-turn-helix transcriptional regulator [Clostridia bacterium]|nr:helix-turn-helix transcriptional regulator [Clostridia bacterium]
MVDKKELRAEIVRNGLTQKKLAEILGMSEKTFITRMQRGVFGTDHVEKMIEVLHIEDPMRVFFAKREA